MVENCTAVRCVLERMKRNRPKEVTEARQLMQKTPISWRKGEACIFGNHCDGLSSRSTTRTASKEPDSHHSLFRFPLGTSLNSFPHFAHSSTVRFPFHHSTPLETRPQCSDAHVWNNINHKYIRMLLLSASVCILYIGVVAAEILPGK